MFWSAQEWGMIMKLPMIAGVIVLAFAAEGAMAACTGTQVTDAALTTLLSNKTVCAGSGVGMGRWQEEHRTDGTLWDYKKGSTDAVDPTKQVGTWAVSGSGAGTIVTHSYTVPPASGPSYNYTVYDIGGGSYSFCGTGGMDFTLTTIGAGC